ncbi:MAG: 2-amino-4-hydroxy-6-hydroxymethyldihydropteridine diphosphokinase [Coriobacteriia bacterium]|nr:2-amino-4-hydroxy-6-hydroxymethyldihydropteridine diphosphokinase [Coriobacteriia bacterium]
MVAAYIALGSNEGNRILNLSRAIDAIAEIPEMHVERVSHAYESEPAYLREQRRFANAVAAVSTGLSAEQLLGYLHEIEDSMGRVRGIENGSRVIDLDILLFGDEESTTPELTIPHPRLAERDFVVTPLLDIAPRLHLPDGTRITRDGATEGVVIGDLGEIPDIGVLLHDMPIVADEWVEVASSSARQDATAGWDSALALKREVLEEAGIPYAWDPYEPEMTMDPFGLPRTFRLLVPEADADAARELLAALVDTMPAQSSSEGTD